MPPVTSMPPPTSGRNRSGSARATKCRPMAPHPLRRIASAPRCSPPTPNGMPAARRVRRRAARYESRQRRGPDRPTSHPELATASTLTLTAEPVTPHAPVAGAASFLRPASRAGRYAGQSPILGRGWPSACGSTLTSCMAPARAWPQGCRPVVGRWPMLQWFLGIPSSLVVVRHCPWATIWDTRSQNNLGI